MNLLIKSSILVLLASASGVDASGGIGEQTGIIAAEDIVDQHWCLHQRRNNRNRSISDEEAARQIAIRTCQSGDTIRNAINALCPNDGTPSNQDVFNLGNRCEKTVNSLIGFPGAQLNEASFVASAAATARASNPTLEGREAGQQAIRDLWVGRRFRSNCRGSNVRSFKRQANTLIYSQFPENTGSSTTRAFNRAARRAAEREISTIESECSPRPTPQPDGFVDGQNAMQQWYKDEGNTCANAWSGIINPAANEIKNSQFPMRGSRTTRAFNQNARAGIDHEVKAIQEKCFSANAY